MVSKKSGGMTHTDTQSMPPERQDQMAEILPLCSPLHLCRLGTTSGCIRTFFVRVRFRILLPYKVTAENCIFTGHSKTFPIPPVLV